ncbi:MAG: DUF2079 domain-containing protein [Bacteroidetes bacterium]|nr:DUF2079 domain-containing protein [Bacteroidota bacterium]
MRKLFLYLASVRQVSISRLQLITVIFFAVIYSLLSLVNHYNFRTYAYDLGLMNNAMYDYAHFRFNNCTLIQPELKNYLSEHFEIFIMLLSPFSYMFGTYTLLIFQITFVLFGGFGVYKYIKEISSSDRISFLAQLHFYFFYGIFSALNFDFHNNVIGAMFVPWFFYFFHLRKWRWAVLFFVFQISTKENMPLWMAFVCAGISLLYWKEKPLRWIAFSFSIMAFAYFILVVKFVMPALANDGEAYVQIRSNYSVLGANMSEVMTTFFTKPVYVFKLFFLNQTSNYLGDYQKMESWIFVLLSGAILFLFRPQFMVMLMPIFVQKMFHNDFLKWGLADHYSVEFAPICSIGAFYVIGKLYDEKWKTYLAYGFAFLSLVMSIRSFDRSYTYFDRDRHRIYQIRHYKKDYDVPEANNALKLIPGDAKVSAQSSFIPHLAFRDYIYQFPVVNDADYVIFSYEENPYPLSKQSFVVQATMLMNADEWKKIYEKNEMVILKRKTISK